LFNILLDDLDKELERTGCIRSLTVRQRAATDYETAGYGTVRTVV